LKDIEKQLAAELKKLQVEYERLNGEGSAVESAGGEIDEMFKAYMTDFKKYAAGEAQKTFDAGMTALDAQIIAHPRRHCIKAQKLAQAELKKAAYPSVGTLGGNAPYSIFRF
jgi:hypothetical protein